MKMTNLINIISGLGLLVSASTLAADCEQAATTEVTTKFKTSFVVGKRTVRVVENVSCEPQRSKKGGKYNACDVGASNGEGAGDMSFRVLLTSDCARVISSFVTGEE